MMPFDMQDALRRAKEATNEKLGVRPVEKSAGNVLKEEPPGQDTVIAPGPEAEPAPAPKPDASPGDVTEEPMASHNPPEEETPLFSEEPIVPKKYRSPIDGGQFSPRKPPTGSDKLVTVKNLPQDVVTVCRGLFPEGANYADLITAFVWMYSGKSFQVSQRVQDLVRDYDHHTATLEQVIDHQKKLEKKLDKMMDTQRESLLGVAYIVFDRLGFRRDTPKQPGDVSFLELGVQDVLGRLRVLTQRLKNDEQKRQGRQLK